MILLLVPTIAVQRSLKNNEIYIILYSITGAVYNFNIVTGTELLMNDT